MFLTVFWSAIFLLYGYGNLILADTPANCTYEDIRGTWQFQEGPRRSSKTIDCSKKCKIKA